MTKRCCSKGHTDNPINGVCPACLLVAEGNADRLETLWTEVRRYLDGYTSRGVHAEGLALESLRKAVQRDDFGAPSPGSPGSPEREEEQRIRNERAARTLQKITEREDQ